MTVYIGPVNKCTDPLAELDQTGRPWGFSECAELITDTNDLKSLHEIAKRSMPYFDWFATVPIPHHRISRRCRQKAIDAGAVSVTQDQLEEIAAKLV